MKFLYGGAERNLCRCNKKLSDPNLRMNGAHHHISGSWWWISRESRGI